AAAGILAIEAATIGQKIAILRAVVALFTRIQLSVAAEGIFTSTEAAIAVTTISGSAILLSVVALLAEFQNCVAAHGRRHTLPVNAKVAHRAICVRVARGTDAVSAET